MSTSSGMSAAAMRLRTPARDSAVTVGASGAVV
jgi:hypothetical protein